MYELEKNKPGMNMALAGGEVDVYDYTIKLMITFSFNLKLVVFLAEKKNIIKSVKHIKRKSRKNSSF